MTVLSSIPLEIQFDEASRHTALGFVQVEINGHEHRFLLDTACAQSKLSWCAHSQTLEKIGVRDSSGVFGRSQYDQVLIERLKFGPLDLSKVSMARAPEGERGYSLLGMDVLKHLSLRFFLSEVRLDVLNDPLELANELEVDQGSIPYVNIELDGRDAKAVWDTGASVTLVDIGFLKRNPDLFEVVGETEGTDSTGRRMTTPLHAMKSYWITGRLFSSHPVVAVDLSAIRSSATVPMDFILGYPTLRQAAWLFDFPRRKWKIESMEN